MIYWLETIPAELHCELCKSNVVELKWASVSKGLMDLAVSIRWFFISVCVQHLIQWLIEKTSRQQLCFRLLAVPLLKLTCKLQWPLQIKSQIAQSFTKFYCDLLPPLPKVEIVKSRYERTTFVAVLRLRTVSYLVNLVNKQTPKCHLLDDTFGFFSPLSWFSLKTIYRYLGLRSIYCIAAINITINWFFFFCPPLIMID